MFAPMTWNDYYRYYLKQLQNIYSAAEASAITGLVFENKTGITRKHLILSPDTAINHHNKEVLDDALKQLLTHKPIQQITGEAWFYNLLFAINEHVLIPRPETEELVKWVVDENPGSISILDIGGGSGCIAVSIKNNLINSTVTSLDISGEALALAKQNANSNKADINFVQLNFLNKAEWKGLPVFDVIVSNPPYIPVSQKEQMDANVIAYEPHVALFVPDDSPLLFYEQIAVFAKTHLKPDGKIYVEIHEDWGAATANIFSMVCNQVEIRRDINGKERMIRATHFL